MKMTTTLLMVLGLGSVLLFPQSINMKTGLFSPALRSDLWQDNMGNLAFSKGDMLNAYYGAEYEVFLDRHTSFSFEVGSYSKDIYTQYRDYTHEDDSPILQNISLRIVPIEANIKLYPLGRRAVLSPYIGFGAGLYAWTYQQYGEFVIFPDAYIEEGFAETETFSFGVNGRAGLVYRFLPYLALAIEGKYQYLRGKLSGYFEGFDLLDLGGITATIGINYYFR
jgi:hypothetical protein